MAERPVASDLGEVIGDAIRRVLLAPLPGKCKSAKKSNPEY